MVPQTMDDILSDFFGPSPADSIRQAGIQIPPLVDNAPGIYTIDNTDQVLKSQTIRQFERGRSHAFRLSHDNNPGPTSAQVKITWFERPGVYNHGTSWHAIARDLEAPHARSQSFLDQPIYENIVKESKLTTRAPSSENSLERKPAWDIFFIQLPHSRT